MRTLAPGITITRKQNGRIILRVESLQMVKEFASYEAWGSWARRVLGRAL